MIRIERCRHTYVIDMIMGHSIRTIRPDLSKKTRPDQSYMRVRPIGFDLQQSTS
jgi:hypothetical protein